MEERKFESFDFNLLVKEPARFESVKDDLRQAILGDFSLRHGTCVAAVADGKVKLTLGQALLNLFLLSFYEGRGLEITKKDLFVKKAISADDLKDYFNMVLARVKEGGKDFEHYRKAVYGVLDEISDISTKTNLLAGNTIDFLDFVQMEVDDPEDVEPLSTVSIPHGLQYNDIERIFKNNGDGWHKYFDAHRERNLSPFTASNTGINWKQATQTMGFVGLKPDFDGTVIPKVITGNFIHGLDNIEDYYIISKGARLALSTNYKMVRKSGYLTRKLSLLMLNAWHDDSIEDCGTRHYVEYRIDNAKKLGMIDGRHYYDIIDGKADYDHLKTVVAENDKDLIGKTIALRSPMTCAHHDHSCRTCYGTSLSHINKNLNTGLAAVLLLTNVLTQRLLSAKHLLATNTDKIEWGEDFDSAFVVNMNSVSFNAEDQRIEISFPRPTEDDYDEDNDGYAVKSFDIRFGDDKRLVHYDSPTTLYLDEKYVPKKQHEDDLTIRISSSSAGNDEIFKFVPHNNELSKSLQNILDLIEASDHLGVTDYNDLVNTFADLLIENGMDDIDSVHAEMIASRLVTDDATGKAVDWTQDVIAPYTINRVSKIVLKSPISTSLSFERLGDQLSNIETYLKDDESIMDALYN